MTEKKTVTERWYYAGRRWQRTTAGGDVWKMYYAWLPEGSDASDEKAYRLYDKLKAKAVGSAYVIELPEAGSTSVYTNTLQWTHDVMADSDVIRGWQALDQDAKTSNDVRLARQRAEKHDWWENEMRRLQKIVNKAALSSRQAESIANHIKHQLINGWYEQGKM